MELANTKTIGAENNNLEYIAAYLKSSTQELAEASQSLAVNLQRTLDLKSMLTLFCEEAAKLIPCQSVAYRNDNQSLFIYAGEKHSHIAQYTLELEGESLGSVECSARRPFTEKELMRLEHLLSILLFPLRNGLLYNDAVMAAQRDALTQLANRTSFDMTIATEISRAQRHGSSLCMLVVDIDHFKKVNDTHGHLAGDQVIKHIASLLTKSLRTEDFVFRFGGEEFVILLSETDLPNARLTAERIRMSIENTPVTVNEQQIAITCSIGVSKCQQGENSNTLFQRADHALYHAKGNGRNQVVVG
ncbi:MAG: GGDEF domain-containing protein [Kangiellaceae bacterium]|nr:GGDEF domain-containing protein [Kangiellaceae bacterium]